MIFCIIFGAIMLIAGIVLFICTDENGIAFSTGVMGAYFFSGGLLMLIKSYEPTAMDVYQGKTTLEYTVKDGVITDSVVVFKYREE